MTKIKLNIEGMTCHACEMLINDTLSDLGVKSSKVNVEAKTAEIDYDDSKINKEDIIEEIKKEGFKVKK
jgi:copper chaperone CopZ